MRDKSCISYVMKTLQSFSSGCFLNICRSRVHYVFVINESCYRDESGNDFGQGKSGRSLTAKSRGNSIKKYGKSGNILLYHFVFCFFIFIREICFNVMKPSLSFQNVIVKLKERVKSFKIKSQMRKMKNR